LPFQRNIINIPRSKERAMSSRFKGVFPPLTTPFIGDEISTDRLRDNILKYNSSGLAGYVISGSTGESVFLSDEETEELVKAAKEAASPEKKIIAGTARESTKETLEFTNRMADLGADAALVRTPSYFKSRLNSEALKKHYLTIADKAKLPVLIYNIPQNTGISVDSKLIIELSKHPNISGIKDSSGNLSALGEVIPFLRPDFNFLMGAGSIFLAGLMQGASGAIVAMANAAPDLCLRLYNLFLEKKFDEALRLQLDLIPLNKAVVQTFGIPGLKYALDLLGYYGGPSRLPLLPLGEEGKKEITTLLKKLGLLEA
jgi:4-hydroxy-2-oxoglutarate aldolase